MASSIETGGTWSTMEDVSLCEAWLQICHCPVSGNEMKFFHMWKKIHAEFCEKIPGSTRTEGLGAPWKMFPYVRLGSKFVIVPCLAMR
ncbi:hypothetical protein L3X38_010619 [Prunus dulcis]|uniref:Uncharacterized protein n=1 Tax=Prunus dulcis TaxID=3755 RepID=A0AAD4ZEX3_PRUDU|nr:hypothetical protein L3X38_010619 [Prunus dulcis]